MQTFFVTLHPNRIQMGGEGTIAGMIISLRNNANMRLRRKKYFTKDNPYLGGDATINYKPKKVKRTAAQIEAFKIKEKARIRRETAIQIFAFLISASVAIAILYFVFGTSW